MTQQTFFPVQPMEVAGQSPVDPAQRRAGADLRLRRRYPSDLTERVWRRVEPLLPQDRPLGRRRRTDLREVINGIHYRWTTGCTWRMLPHDFPPWVTVYAYFHRWSRDGTLQRIRESLLRRGGDSAVSTRTDPEWPPSGRTPSERRNDPDFGTNPQNDGGESRAGEIAPPAPPDGCAEGCTVPH